MPGAIHSSHLGLVVAALTAACAPERTGVAPTDPTGVRTLFEIPPARDPGRVGLGFFSHERPGARRNHVHADDFALEATASVHGVRVWCLPEHADDLGNFEAFTLRIHADRSGGPGEVLASVTRSLDDVEPMPTGRRGSGEGEANSAPEYVLELHLEAPLELAADVPHYVSVTAHRVDPAGATWQWQDGEHRDRVGWSHRIGDPTWQAIEDEDSAFAVLGR